MSASLILPKLHLGPRKAAHANVLNARGIKSVLSLCKTNLDDEVFKFLYFEIVDSPDQDIMDLFRPAILFLVEQRLAGESSLVHCSAGVSRSASFVIAYLMTIFSWSFDEAYKYTHYCRDIIEPNSGFVKQLEEFGNEIRNDLRGELREEFGKDYDDMVAKDLMSVESILSGTEVSVMVQSARGTEFLKVHSSDLVQVVERLASALLPQGSHLFLQNEPADLCLRIDQLDGIDLHSIIFDWK